MWAGALNREDEDYDYHALGLRVAPPLADAALAKDYAPPAWGCLIHPDELRNILFVGNSLLITVNGEQLQDYQLKNWTDHNVQVLAQKLQWDIYPRLWRHRPVMATERRVIEPFAEWEDVYKKPRRGNQSFLVSLRHRPLCQLHSWKVVSAYQGQDLIDLLPYAMPNYGAGLLEAPVFNLKYGAPTAQPIAAWRMGQSDMPLIHCVDYTTGYERADLVPDELKQVILNRMIIDVMSAYGDGIVGGMANSSVSVGVLSESVGTTMSATSAYFGARILEKVKWEDDWFKTRASSYRRIGFRSL